jgi:hypothetical protein
MATARREPPTELRLSICGATPYDFIDFRQTIPGAFARARVTRAAEGFDQCGMRTKEAAKAAFRLRSQILVVFFQ